MPMLRSLMPVAKSFKYIEKRMGLMISPCLTPDVTLNESVSIPLILIRDVDKLYMESNVLKSRP